MKLLFTVTFLASLAFGSASNSKLGKNNHASNRDDEDFEYWRNLVDTVGSLTTNAPTKSPVDSPTPPPVTDPTSAPVATTLAPSAPSTEVCKPIAEVLCTTPEFATLCSLVTAAGLTDILTTDTLTLFAPTVAAFEELPEELVAAALADTDLLTFILLGHAVARQEILTKDLICDGGPIDALNMANEEETTITCTSSIDSDGNTESNTFIAGGGNLEILPRIIGPDGLACNGIVHAIDYVILPAPAVTDAPVAAPVADPTSAPVAPVADPTLAPVVDPTSAPVAPVADPTPAPVAPTAAPVVPTAAPIAPTEAPTSGTSGIEARLAPFTLNGGAEFADTSSYQYQALKQTELQVGVEDFSDAKLTQYYALYCIYFATNGVPNQITDADPRFVGIPFPSWLQNGGWDATDVDPCSFYGIICDSESRVSTIDLFENLLTGAFPPEIKILSLDGPDSTGAGNLFRIDVFRNEFLYNNADSSWMTDLGSNMTTIIAEETAFAGDIPRLPDSLVNFDISFAYYTGGLLDANFEGLDKLSFVDLDGNAFNSTIPSVFGRLPSLEFLYLSDSFLSGDLSYMDGMSSIREHWMDTNPGLKGPIFDFIGSLSTLESWSMTFNSVTGTLPSTLGNLQNMQQMWLYSNLLTGTIPSELGNLSSMKILQLEGNSFVGSMPDEVCANTAFPTQVIETLGADCDDEGFVQTCETCCSVLECTS